MVVFDEIEKAHPVIFLTLVFEIQADSQGRSQYSPPSPGRRDIDRWSGSSSKFQEYDHLSHFQPWVRVS